MNYVNPPFNYSGSKTRLLDQILPLFDYNKEYFIDLFVGGGSVYTNILDRYKKVLINDVIGDLIEIHKKLSTNPQIFIETVRNLAKTKENQKLYLDLKESYNKEKSPEKLYALMLSCTNNALRFNRSGEFNQSWGQREWNDSTEKKVKEFVEYIAKYKDKIYYTSGHFSKVKPTKPSMIYVDPPYGYCVDENGKITNKQVSEAGYNSFWYQKDDIELYNYILELDKNKHSFMLSGVLEHDDKKSWIINKMIQDKFNYKELDYNYNGVSRKGAKKTTEVIITNY
jgi:DNA adenine methylase Dam